MTEPEFELHPDVLKILRSKYNILFQSDCREFDCDNFTSLEDSLRKLEHRYYSPTDKILLVHLDTDYYDPLLAHGLIPINVLRIFENLEIPYHALLFVTNHFGIEKEFNALLKDIHLKDRPTIIESLLSKKIIVKNYKAGEKTIDAEEIKKQGLCMMNKQRSHRVFLYNFIKDQNLLTKIATSQRFS